LPAARLLASNFSAKSSKVWCRGFFILSRTPGSTCSGATLSLPLTWWAVNSSMYAGESLARSMRIPEATKTLRMPGTARAARMRSTRGPWSVPSSLHTTGWTQERRRQTFSTSGRVQRMRYMFAVGPPMSLTTPLNSGSAAIVASSPSTLSFDRDWMVRPWCAVMEQKVQPPKQPRMIVTESLIISNAGTGAA
jgi:hypothetical protein